MNDVLGVSVMEKCKYCEEVKQLMREVGIWALSCVICERSYDE